MENAERVPSYDRCDCRLTRVVIWGRLYCDPGLVSICFRKEKRELLAGLLGFHDAVERGREALIWFEKDETQRETELHTEDLWLGNSASIAVGHSYGSGLFLGSVSGNPHGLPKRSRSAGVSHPEHRIGRGRNRILLAAQVS